MYILLMKLVKNCMLITDIRRHVEAGVVKLIGN